MYHLNEFCNILTALRKQKGWTQTYLAEQIGISSQAVSKWENGIGYPDVTLFPTLAQMFNIPIAVLFGERNEFFEKGIGMKAYTLNFRVPENYRIEMGNVCRVEIIQGMKKNAAWLFMVTPFLWNIFLLKQRMIYLPFVSKIQVDQTFIGNRIIDVDMKRITMFKYIQVKHPKRIWIFQL